MIASYKQISSKPETTNNQPIQNELKQGSPKLVTIQDTMPETTTMPTTKHKALTTNQADRKLQTNNRQSINLAQAQNYKQSTNNQPSRSPKAETRNNNEA